MLARRLRSQSGSSLIELVVGSAIALIVLGAAVSLQISTYRLHRADQVQFEAQLQASLAMEQIVRDLRAAAAWSADESRITIEIAADAGEVRYVEYRLSESLDLVREEGGRSRAVAVGVSLLAFAPQADGSIQITIATTLADGQLYTLTSSVSPHNNPYG